MGSPTREQVRAALIAAAPDAAVDAVMALSPYPHTMQPGCTDVYRITDNTELLAEAPQPRVLWRGKTIAPDGSETSMVPIIARLRVERGTRVAVVIEDTEVADRG